MNCDGSRWALKAPLVGVQCLAVCHISKCCLPYIKVHLLFPLLLCWLSKEKWWCSVKREMLLHTQSLYSLPTSPVLGLPFPWPPITLLLSPHPSRMENVMSQSAVGPLQYLPTHKWILSWDCARTEVKPRDFKFNGWVEGNKKQVRVMLFRQEPLIVHVI